MSDARRSSFDSAAELYDRVRPGYPAGLFEDVARLANIGKGSRIVEIGAGAGQATTGLLALGADVTCIEPGEALATILRRKFAGRSLVVEAIDFEDWSTAPGSVDAMVAFTSWHWVRPESRAAAAARALRSGGALATVTTSHVTNGTSSDDAFEDLQCCYEHWAPETTALHWRLPGVQQIAETVDEVDDSADFVSVERRRHEQDITYTTTEYVDVLRTYSDIATLEPEVREGLLGDIATRIEERHGGRLTKRYLYDLRVAVRQ